jgi:hypothetical protein
MAASSKLCICLAHPYLISTDVLLVLSQDEWQGHLQSALRHGWAAQPGALLRVNGGALEEYQDWDSFVADAQAYIDQCIASLNREMNDQIEWARKAQEQVHTFQKRARQSGEWASRADEERERQLEESARQAEEAAQEMEEFAQLGPQSPGIATDPELLQLIQEGRAAAQAFRAEALALREEPRARQGHGMLASRYEDVRLHQAEDAARGAEERVSRARENLAYFQQPNLVHEFSIMFQYRAPWHRIAATEVARLAQAWRAVGTMAYDLLAERLSGGALDVYPKAEYDAFVKNKPRIRGEARPAARFIPSEVRARVWERDGGRCARCGSVSDLEFDHIIPVAKGGNSTENNIELLCLPCNRRKSAHIM